jgi:hypothetical protein
MEHPSFRAAISPFEPLFDLDFTGIPLLARDLFVDVPVRSSGNVPSNGEGPT